MSSLLCPLCKRSVSQEIAAQGSSRLCAECRSMIATIIPQNRQAQTSVGTALATAPPAVASVVTLPTPAPASASAPVQSVPERFAAEMIPARHPEPLEMPQAGNFATAEAPSFSVAARASEIASLPQTTTTVGNLALDSSLESQPFVDAQTEAKAVEEDSPFNAAKTAKHVQSPVMDDVPPSWDNTPDQYHPRLVPEERSKSGASRHTAILALLVIAGLAGGFLLFKAFFKPKTETAKNEPQTQVQTQVPQSSVSALAPVEKPSAPPSTSAPQKNEAKPEPTTKAASPEKPALNLPDANENGGQGSLSLQAMLLSTPTAANDFVEKLKKAGIPAYVSPSGSKFKILIGKFATEADARHYIATAKERAKTVGVDLQGLFVNKD